MIEAAFVGIIVGVSAWVIWRDEPVLGSVNDPYGDAGEWTASELRGYLQAVCLGPSTLPVPVGSC